MKVNAEVKNELIINALDSADIGYWARVPKGADHEDLLAGIATATVQEIDESDGSVIETFTLTSAKVRKGLTIMAEKYPHHMADLLKDNSDCWTGDCLVQCALFGELRYG
jgi:hypothetical protein